MGRRDDRSRPAGALGAPFPPATGFGSLRRRLPLLISGVLFAVVAAVCVTAYQQFKSVLVDAAAHRIMSATQQLGSALEQSTSTMHGEMHRMAAEPAVVHAFRDVDAARSEFAELFAREHSRAAQLSALTLLHVDGHALLTVDSAGVRLPPAWPIVPRHNGGAIAAGVGPPVVSLSGVHYDIVLPVVRHADTLGFLVVTRRTSAGAGGNLIARLIGSDARVLFRGNAGGEWTDLDHGVAGLPRGVDTDGASEYTAADGTRFLLSVVRLQSMPWVVAVESPREAALAPARRFLLTIIAVSWLILLAGMIVSWRLSRQLTDPLAEIAHAADDFARGDYARRADVVRRDELGSVASAFNAMAESVERNTRKREIRELELESANRELGESEERYRHLVELLPDGIVVHRGGDATILFGNAAAVQLLAAESVATFAGRSFLDFVPPADREGIAGYIASLHRERRPTPLVERALRRLDGGPISVEMAAIPLMFCGKPAILTLLRDVSQKKRLEEQIRQSQKMEAVGQLAGGVAHDFNNILTVIMSYSGLLLSTVEATSDIGRDLLEINMSAERAAGLTRQLLAFSRRQVIQPRLLDLNALASGLESMLRRLLQEDIELVFRLHPQPALVNADPGQVEQVIVNLAVNARDAMPNGGQLVIETASVDLDDDSSMLPPGAAAGSYVVLAISDTGHGMDASTRSRIFDPFFTTKEPGRGTGLGLATVYGIVQQSGGSISAYSEPGVGTTFKVYLPHASGAATPLLAPDTRDVDDGSETILVVEDDERVRTVAERVLARAGYVVLLASTGTEALTLLDSREATVDLVLTDLVMPAMGGRELATRIQVRWPATRIVFMSGYTEDAASRSSVLAPDAFFLDKPFTPDTLRRKVRQALYGEASVVAD